MKLEHAKILITGASGGIGAATVRELLRGGARVLMTARNERTLRELAHELDPSGASLGVLAADVSRPQDRREIADLARSWCGGVNVLINNAGIPASGMFTDMQPDEIERTFAVNAVAPLQLCRALLPHLKRQPRAQIVNVGSVFGAIGYPGHTIYSATKFALRGFSEALRRELADTNVRVHYLAPRATRTRFNGEAIDALNAELGVATDPPERVAAGVRRLIETERAEAVIGWPEKLFVRINALLPRLVDRSLGEQLPAIQRRLTYSSAELHPIKRSG